MLGLFLLEPGPVNFRPKEKNYSKNDFSSE